MTNTKQEKKKETKWFHEASIQVRVNEKGLKYIAIHQIPKELFNEIAKMCNKPIQKYGMARWIDFTRARDKSEVTIFSK